MARPALDIEVKFDEKDLMRYARMLSHISGGMERMQMGAINKTLRSLRTDFTRTASSRANIKQKAIRDKVVLKYAKRAYLAGHMILSNERIPLADLDARQTQKGVTFRGRSGRKLKRHAFIRRLGGRKHVFRRAGDDDGLVPRLPIIKQMGPSIAHLFEDIGMLEAETMANANSKLSHFLEQEVNWMLEKYRG